MVVRQLGKIVDASSLVQNLTVTYVISTVTNPPIASRMDFAFLLIVQLIKIITNELRLASKPNVIQAMPALLLN